MNARFLMLPEGRAELVVVIDPTLTVEQLRKAWPALAQQRQWLLEWDGTDFESTENRLKLEILRMLEDGFSQLEIALHTNLRVLNHIVWACWAEGDGNAEMAAFYGSLVRTRLRAFGIKAKDIKTNIDVALAAVRENRVLWRLRDGPVDKQRVVDIERQLLRQVESRRLVRKNLPDPESPLTDYRLNTWDQHNEL